MKKSIILTATLVALAGAAMVGATQVSAHAGHDHEKGQTSLVQLIANKFGLKQDDVQAVFDQHKKDMQSQMQAKMEERLTQLVTEGKLTEAQKQLIINKHKEMQQKHQAEMESIQNKTPEERKEIMQKHKAEMEAWAKQNNIDVQYLGMFKIRGHGRMMNK